MGHVDLHLHGAYGVDLLTADVDDFDHLTRALERRGYASFLPTLVPLPMARLERVLERMQAWLASRHARDGRGAMPLGVHFEGPFLSPERSGALDPRAFLDGRNEAAVERFLHLASALPGATMITLAPEIDGGLELVAECARREFLVSLGHTAAGLATLEQAVANGARHMTHFCNAMAPLHHREPGPIGFGLLHGEVTIDVIADGHHLHPEMLRLILQVKDASRIALISDAMPAAGLADGDHEVWGQTVHVAGGAARTAGGALAGSTHLLDEGVAFLHGIGVPRERALACASDVPLRILETARRRD